MDRTTLKRIVEESDTRAGRAFDLTIQFLVVVSLVSFSLETLPGLAESTHRILRSIEVATVTIFTFEYGLRLFVADRPLHFARSFFGVVDLLAILPFYLSAGVDLRSLRAVRFLRIVRILKLTRYSKAVQRMHRAITITREELLLFFGVTLVLLYLAAVGIYYFEREAQPKDFASVFHSLWWAVATLTTVGYGDVYPITLGGRLFTFLILMIGLGTIAVPSGLFASALSAARREEEEARKAARGAAGTEP